MLELEIRTILELVVGLVLIGVRLVVRFNIIRLTGVEDLVGVFLVEGDS